MTGFSKNDNAPRQNNTEVKLQAALLLLSEMTSILVKHVMSEGGDPSALAEAHYDAFEKATVNHPEVHAAGMEISQQFIENGGYSLDA